MNAAERDFRDALEHLERILTLRRLVVGDEHPDTATSYAAGLRTGHDFYLGQGMILFWDENSCPVRIYFSRPRENKIMPCLLAGRPRRRGDRT